MEEINKIYLNLINNPNMLKTYKDLKQYYLSTNFIEESEAIDYLIKEKFNEFNLTYFDAKQ